MSQKDSELRDKIKKQCFGLDDNELDTEIAYRDKLDVVTEIENLIATHTNQLIDELLEGNYHYWRECIHCGDASYGYLHCLHDKIQNNCHNCKGEMESLPDIDCNCLLVVPVDQVTAILEKKKS